MAEPEAAVSTEELDLQYVQYEPAKEEQHLPAIRQLISKDLSEPYSIYVYRYFLYQWGDLCYMVPLLLFILVPMLFLHISKPC
jgi:peptide alpha-N-acetyltransferase